MVGFTYLGIRLFASQDIGALLGDGSFEFPTFLLAVSLGAGWQLTYGPYVADYSRYLPRDDQQGQRLSWPRTLARSLARSGQ